MAECDYLCRSHSGDEQLSIMVGCKVDEFYADRNNHPSGLTERVLAKCVVSSKG